MSLHCQRISIPNYNPSADIYIAIGTGSGAMGRHTKRGGYLIDWNKVRTYVVPDLTDFNVSVNFSFNSFALNIPKLTHSIVALTICLKKDHPSTRTRSFYSKELF
jgi:hypothetical protein